MKPLFYTSIKFGVIAANLSILIILIVFYQNKHPLLLPIYIDYRIFILSVFIYFGIKKFKLNQNNEYLQFWQGILIGIIIYIIVGIIVSVFIIFFSYLEPSFYDQYISKATIFLLENKNKIINEGKITMSEEQFNRELETLKQTPIRSIGIDYFIKTCFIGFFITIIMAIVLRKSQIRY